MTSIKVKNAWAAAAGRVHKQFFFILHLWSAALFICTSAPQRCRNQPLMHLSWSLNAMFLAEDFVSCVLLLETAVIWKAVYTQRVCADMLHSLNELWVTVHAAIFCGAVWFLALVIHPCALQMLRKEVIRCVCSRAVYITSLQQRRALLCVLSVSVGSCTVCSTEVKRTDLLLWFKWTILVES